MPQLHMYVPQRTAEVLRRQAQERGMSVSGYLAEIVVREAGGGEWPEGFFEEVLGGWDGEFVRPLQGEYEVRADLSDLSG